VKAWQPGGVGTNLFLPSNHPFEKAEKIIIPAGEYCIFNAH